MLLARDYVSAFQNISCYCLTRNLHQESLYVQYSKHLLLLFNINEIKSILRYERISKYLMLLFNKNQIAYLLCENFI